MRLMPWLLPGLIVLALGDVSHDGARSIPDRQPTGITYYVSPTGNDANDGLSPTFPKRTIKTTLNLLGVADTLYLLDGTYNRTNQGGDANMKGFQLPADRVTVAAHAGAAPVIDWTGVSLFGTDRFLNGWNFVDDGVIMGITFRNWTNGTTFILNVAGDHLRIVDCVFDRISPTGNYPIVGVQGVSATEITGCSFVNRSPASLYYTIYLEGSQSSPAGREDFLVRDCQFNSEADLADTLGRAGGVLAIRVDGLIVLNCVGFNAGHDHSQSGDTSHFIELADVDDAVIGQLTFTRYLRGKGQSSFVHDADGVHIAEWMGEPSENVTVTTCGFWGAGHGVTADVGAHDIHIQHVWCDSTYDDCVFANDLSRSVTIERVVSHYSQDNAIDIKGDSVTVSHCTAVRPRNQAITVSELAGELHVSDVLVYDVRDPAVWHDIVALVEPATSGWSFDYDLWFDPDGSQTRFRFDGATQSFTQWQSAGHDIHGYWADPLFENPGGRAWPLGSTSFALLPGSPATGTASDGGNIGAIGPGGTVVVDEPDPDPAVAAGPILAVRPNPTRGNVLIDYRDASGDGAGTWDDHAASRDRVSEVSIFDSGGRLVQRFTSAPGDGELIWDGRDRHGWSVAPGTYFVRVSVETGVATARAVMLGR